MRTMISVFVVITLCLTLLVGCNNQQNEVDELQRQIEELQNQNSQTPTPMSAPEPTVKPTEEPADEAFDKYDKMWDDIYAAGVGHEWSASDSWSKDQQEAYDTINAQAILEGTQGIVDYVWANYQGYYESYSNVTVDQVKADKRFKVWAAMPLWGFGTFDADAGTYTGSPSETVWTLTGDSFPTVEDFYNEIILAHEGDIIAADGETANEPFSAVAKDRFIRQAEDSEPIP